MKIPIILLFLAVFTAIPSGMYGQTQLEMNQQARQEYEQADKELNKTYRQILAEYKSDPAFVANLKKAQRLWIQWRDAEMKSLYPDREEGYYGSIHPYCWNTSLARLTLERTKQLSIWLQGVEEGNACASSVKTTESGN